MLNAAAYSFYKIWVIYLKVSFRPYDSLLIYGRDPKMSPFDRRSLFKSTAEIPKSLFSTVHLPSNLRQKFLNGAFQPYNPLQSYGKNSKMALFGRTTPYKSTAEIPKWRFSAVQLLLSLRQKFLKMDFRPYCTISM